MCTLVCNCIYQRLLWIIVLFILLCSINNRAMKKVITLLAMTIVLGTISFAQSNGQNQALGKARGAAKDCLKRISKH